MTAALAAVLTPYFTFMRRYQMFLRITHIPGISMCWLITDDLSRFNEPLSTTLDPTAQMTFPWRDLLKSSGIEVTQVGRKWPSNF